MIKTISVFGDSLVYGMGDSLDGGWVTRVQHKIKGKNKFLNFGIPGDTSKDLLERIDEELSESKPGTVIVFIGANDSQYKNSPENTLINIEQYKNNLEKIVEKIKKYKNEIIFIGLPKMNDDITTDWHYIYNFCNNNLQKYDAIIKNFCKENSFKYIRLFDLLEESDLDDGAHPNSKGYEKIADRIEVSLRENIA